MSLTFEEIKNNPRLFKPLTDYGQIKLDDTLIIYTCYGRFIAEVKESIRGGTKDEEVLIHKKKNHYFIVSAFLEGKSWVDECFIIKGFTIKGFTIKGFTVYKPYKCKYEYRKEMDRL